jgi:hypothetical protein
MTNPMPPEMAMPAEQTPEPTSQGGEVSMSIPKADFDNLYDLIMQLASTLESMKSTVDTQEMASGEGMPMEPEGITPNDAADLEMFAKELNSRSA